MTTCDQPTRQVATTGVVFTNGMIELVADQMQDGGLKLLLWKDQETRVQSSITLGERRDCGSDSEDQTVTYVPADLDISVRQAMRFPSHPEPFGSSRQLLEDICKEIKAYTKLSDELVVLAAHAVRASWFPEASDSPIGLAIYGPLCPQGQQLFRVLSCMYRRALWIGEISPGALCALPMELSPSLFIERYHHIPGLQKLIRATFSGGYTPSKGKLVRTGCTTVICTDEPLIDVTPGWNLVEIPVSYGWPVSPILPALNQDRQQEIAAKFQPKLLMYRLMHYCQVMNSTFNAAPLTSPVSRLVRCLAASVVDDPTLQTDLVNALRRKDEQIQQELSSDTAPIVSEALFSLCHQDKRQSIRVGDLTAAVNSILEEHGELFSMTSRMVGSKLRLLGFTTLRLDQRGRGLPLKHEVRKRIHSAAWNYRVEFPRAHETQCYYCQEILQEDEEERLQDDFDLEKVMKEHEGPNDPFVAR